MNYEGKNTKMRQTQVQYLRKNKRNRIENNRRSFCRDEKAINLQYWAQNIQKKKKIRNPGIFSWNFITLDTEKKKKTSQKCPEGKNVGSLLRRRASNSHHLWLMLKGKGQITLNLGGLRRKWGRKGEKKEKTFSDTQIEGKLSPVCPPFYRHSLHNNLKSKTQNFIAGEENGWERDCGHCYCYFFFCKTLQPLDL